MFLFYTFTVKTYPREVFKSRIGKTIAYAYQLLPRMPYYLKGNSRLKLRNLLPDKWTPDNEIVKKYNKSPKDLYSSFKYE